MKLGYYGNSIIQIINISVTNDEYNINQLDFKVEVGYIEYGNFEAFYFDKKRR